MADFAGPAGEAETTPAPKPKRGCGGTPRADPQAMIDAAIIEANGRACEGLGRAVAILMQKGMITEAQELALQLKYASKSLSWLLKEVVSRRGPSNTPPAGESRRDGNPR